MSENNGINEYNKGYDAYVAKDYNGAINYWNLSADQGNQDAMFSLGLMYWRGEGVKEDLGKALGYMSRAADKGYTRAKTWLADVILHDRGIIPNFVQARNLLIEAANEGDQRAHDLLERFRNPEDFEATYPGHSPNHAFQMALSYVNGWFVDKKPEAATKWFAEAVNLGNTKALYHLAMSYYDGIGVAKDVNKAAELLIKGVEKDEKDAFRMLAAFYRYGIGVPQDYGKFFELTKKAADKGDIVGIHNLGEAYLMGQGTAKNPGEALRLFQLAAKYNFLPSIDNLADMYYSGDGVPQDYNEAFRLYSTAAERGHIESYSILGYLYMTGKGTIIDKSKARECFEKIYNRPDIWENKPKQYYDSLLSLGSLYYEGEGGPRNVAKAIEIWDMLVKKGIGGAAFNLGIIFRFGGTGGRKDVTPNPVQADYYFDIASRSGYKEMVDKIKYQHLYSSNDDYDATEFFGTILEGIMDGLDL